MTYLSDPELFAYIRHHLDQLTARLLTPNLSDSDRRTLETQITELQYILGDELPQEAS